MTNGFVMKFTLNFFTALVLFYCSISAGCMVSKEAGNMVVGEAEVFLLPLGKTAKVKEKNVELTFTEVQEDSRCPLNTNCIWEGQVKIRIALKQPDKTTPVVFVRKGQETQPLIQKVDGIEVKVLEITPYPEEGKPLKKEQYTLKLLIN